MLLCFVFLAGCTPASNQDDRSAWVRYGTGTPMQTFDPHLADTGPSFSTYIALVYDGLTRVDTEKMGNAVPGLASDWRWIDNRTLEFDLRPGVRFIDGEPFNARAAVANIERMIEKNGPRIATVASVKSAEAIGELKLRLNLAYPDPTVLYNLALSPGMMVSPAAFDNADLDLNPVGTGAWIYDQENSRIGEVHRFRLNPDYYEGHPPGRAPYEIYVLKDTRARLNALVSGQIDFTVMGASEADYAKKSGFFIASRKNRWLGLTLLDRQGILVPAFRDVRVRRALGFAVDRDALARVVYFGFAAPASQPMADLGHVRALENYYTYDPAHARALLEEAGAVGTYFEVPVVPTSSAEYEAIQHYVNQVGFNMEIKIIEPGTIAPIARSLDYPINTIGYPNFDPDNRHTAIWGSDAAFNPFRNPTPRLNELAQQARETLDEAQRAALFQEYFQIVVTEAHSVIYLQVEDLVAYDADKLIDVTVSRYIDPNLSDVRLRNHVGQE
ncbi:MAG: ABC transporter substrate-binding protein [Pseudomonadota bacterium]